MSSDRDARSACRRWTGTIAWVLLVLASMVLIGYGIARANWHIYRTEATHRGPLTRVMVGPCGVLRKGKDAVMLDGSPAQP